MAVKKSNLKVLWENPDPKQFTRIVQFGSGGHKFRMHIEHSNGSPCGFNYKCALSIMTSDGNWSHLTDNRELGVDWRNDYCERDNRRLNAINAPAIAAFEKYITAVFAD